MQAVHELPRLTIERAGKTARFFGGFMKKIIALILAIVGVAGAADAQRTEADLMGSGMPGLQAQYVMDLVDGSYNIGTTSAPIPLIYAGDATRTVKIGDDNSVGFCGTATNNNFSLITNDLVRWTVKTDGTLANNATNGSDLSMERTGTTVAIQEATAGSACMGTVTFNGTTAVTKSTTCATTGSRIFLSPTSDPTGSTAAYCWATNIVNGVSFDVDCDQANDGTANFIIFHEAP